GVVCANAAADAAGPREIGWIRTSAVLPLGAGSCIGIALDSAAAAESVSSAVRCLQPAGRIVAPASTELPGGLTELARDSDFFVAAKTPELTSLRKASR